MLYFLFQNTTTLLSYACWAMTFQAAVCLPTGLHVHKTLVGRALLLASATHPLCRCRPKISMSARPADQATPSSIIERENSERSSVEAKELEQLLDVGNKIIDQALDLIDNSLSSDEELTISSKFLPGSTIGAS